MIFSLGFSIILHFIILLYVCVVLQQFIAICSFMSEYFLINLSVQIYHFCFALCYFYWAFVVVNNHFLNDQRKIFYKYPNKELATSHYWNFLNSRYKWWWKLSITNSQREPKKMTLATSMPTDVREKVKVESDSVLTNSN